MNSLQTTTDQPSTSIPAPNIADERTDFALRKWRSRIGYVSGRAVMLSDEELPADDRGLLESRRAVLEKALNARDRQAVAAAISRLMMSMRPGQPVNEKTAHAVVGSYLEALAGQPVWAVLQACMDWRQGRGANTAHPPTTAQLVELSNEIANAAWRERNQILEILSAPVERRPIDPAAAKRIGEGLETLANDLEDSLAAEAEARRQKRAAQLTADNERLRLRELEDAGLPADSPHSAALLRKVGEWTGERMAQDGE